MFPLEMQAVQSEKKNTKQLISLERVDGFRWINYMNFVWSEPLEKKVVTKTQNNKKNTEIIFSFTVYFFYVKITWYYFYCNRIE
jgi:hypothetical protein